MVDAVQHCLKTFPMIEIIWKGKCWLGLYQGGVWLRRAMSHEPVLPRRAASAGSGCLRERASDMPKYGQKAHQQDRRISRIGASARSAHQQDGHISRIVASTGSVHQQDRRISRIAASAGLAHQQDRFISRISASERCITTCGASPPDVHHL